jgi:hypothetical protein
MGLQRTKNLVLSAEITDGAVTLAKLPDGVLTADADGRAKMADDFVNSAKVAANEIASADLAVSTVQYAEVEISAEEILALYTTPKTLVAAPGAGKVLEFISLLLAYDYGTTAYTIGTATDLQVKYTDASGAAVSTTQAVTGFIDQATDQLRALDKLEASVTPVDNAALVLTLAVANVTDGDGAIHAKVAYRVHATGL